MGFDDDDFFAGGGGFGNPDAFSYNEYAQPAAVAPSQSRSAPTTRPSRQRRASCLGVTSATGSLMSLNTPIVPTKPTRTKSSDCMGSLGASTTRSGSRRSTATSELVPSSSSSSSRSGGGGGSTSANSHNLNGRLEAVKISSVGSGSTRSSTGTGGGDRSVTSNGSNSNSQRRSGGRRASIAATGSTSSRSTMSQPRQKPSPQYEEADYGYDEQQPSYQNHNNYNPREVEDMGYGDRIIEDKEEFTPPVAQAEPVRARRQRRCSIADVVNTASIQPSAAVDYGYGNTTEGHSSAAPEDARAMMMQQQRIGAIGNASISNMAIPMTLSDEPKRTNRRGSIAMLGNIGRPKASKEAEAAASTTKKPAADRDRQRQGTLMDRVGAGTSNDGRGAMRTGKTSYSDRILSK